MSELSQNLNEGTKIALASQLVQCSKRCFQVSEQVAGTNCTFLT